MSIDNSKHNLRIIAYSGVLAALVFTGTMIHVPTAIGHINLGDPVILISSYIMGPWGALPAAVGAALSDLISGYPQYVIPTFIIKGIMGLVAGLIMKTSGAGKVPLIRKISASLVAEAIMVAGYFAFESLPFMYGVTAAIGSIIPNLIQAGAAIIGAIPLTFVPLIRDKSIDS